MAGQPGLAGSQFPGNDALIRRIQDLEKTVQQLAAADPFAPMGMKPAAGGIIVNGSETVTGSLTVNGSANFTGNTTIGGTATVAGNVTKSNSWGSASLGDAAVVGTPGAGSPAVTFTRSGASFGQSVGMGIKEISGNTTQTALVVNGPHATDPAFLALRSDQTFTLASTSVAGAGSSPYLSSTTGPNGTLQIFGGGTNGSVQLLSYGTGNVQVYGNFAVTGSKAFVMDHPVHPDTMELMHAATESPVNGVEYWGSVTLDATGQATATLPGYFEALTKPTDRNIQLTPIGRTAAQVSADRITGGAFTIYGAPGQEVDWIVKAERQRVVDGYDELSFPAEQDKPLIGPQLATG